jgi:uroporphyrinogen decarboxylase
MTSRQRLLTALDRGVPDRLPVTTHHLMPWFLQHCLGGLSPAGFFDRFGLDAIDWVFAHRPEPSEGARLDPDQGEIGYLDVPRLVSDDWRVTPEPVSGRRHPTTRYRITTPGGELTTVLEHAPQTDWVVERLIKQPREVNLIARWAPAPRCDIERVHRHALALGERGIVRGAIPGFEIYGQPGCWQDAAVLVGIQELILATFDDPAWVHTLLGVLQERKLRWLASSAGASYDLLELGGGDASTTVISPALFETFVAPYDAPLVAAAHSAGQRIVYHTCGGMMPILEALAGLGADSLETFTPPSLGGDTDLAGARRRIGDRVCMIGSFDQARYLRECTPEETRRAVRACFEAAGEGGGYILAPSDHFFEAEPALLEAFTEEAHTCVYPSSGPAPRGASPHDA